MPADEAAIVLPATSVMVMTVLLNVDRMCATPVWMFFRTFFLTFFALATPMKRSLLRRLLLAGDRLAWALPGTRVGVGALAAHRQSLAMAEAAVAADVHQHLDVLLHLAAQVALDLVLTLDHVAQ